MKVKLCCGVLCDFVIFLFSFFSPETVVMRLMAGTLSLMALVVFISVRRERRGKGLGVGWVLSACESERM